MHRAADKKEEKVAMVVWLNVPWMTTAVTDLSMQNLVPLDRAYCSENFLIISKFFADGPSHFVTMEEEEDDEWRDDEDVVLVLFTRTDDMNVDEDRAVRDVWEIAKLIVYEYVRVSVCVRVQR